MNKERYLLLDLDGVLFNSELLANNIRGHKKGEVFKSDMAPRINFKAFQLEELVYPDVVEVLETLQKRGATLLLFSEGDKEGQLYKLRELSGLGEFFPQERRFIYEDKKKVELIAEVLDSTLAGVDIWAVDDKPEALKSIKECDESINTVLMCQGSHWKKALSNFEPDYKVRNLTELERILSE